MSCRTISPGIYGEFDHGKARKPTEREWNAGIRFERGGREERGVSNSGTRVLPMYHHEVTKSGGIAEIVAGELGPLTAQGFRMNLHVNMRSIAAAEGISQRL
jgi:hypothetical protein